MAQSTRQATRATRTVTPRTPATTVDAPEVTTVTNAASRRAVDPPFVPVRSYVMDSDIAETAVAAVDSLVTTLGLRDNGPMENMGNRPISDGSVVTYEKTFRGTQNTLWNVLIMHYIRAQVLCQLCR